MNSIIAQLLKDRISQFAYVDRLAGIVRAVEREQAGGTITIPIAIDVDDPLACDDSSLRDLVPDERYACMVYFEDKGCRAVQSRTRGTSFECRMRLVCWVNTARFNGDAHAADRIMQQFIGAIPSGVYNDGPFIGVRHTIEAVPERGKAIFAAYSYPAEKRQYLLHPFDAFAIDILTVLRIKPGCEDQVNTTNAECWTPPANRRRRFPSEFTCEELNAPITGLTDEQKGECLDCAGGGECLPLSFTLRNSADDVLLNGLDNSPCGSQLTITAPDGTVQRQDAAGANIGSPIAVRSGQTGLNVTCPDGTVSVRNLNGTALGSVTVKSNGTSNYNAPIPLKFALAAGQDESITHTVTDDEAGAYTTYTQDGASGTLTYSLNGAAFASLTGTIALAVGNTIAVRRTVFSASGWIKWAP